MSAPSPTRLGSLNALRGLDMRLLLVAGGVVLRHALVRAGVMVVIAWCVDGNLLTYDPAKSRLTYSVLQMLAVASVAGTLFARFAASRPPGLLASVRGRREEGFATQGTEKREKENGENDGCRKLR